MLEHETKRVSAQGGALTLAEGLHRHLTGRAIEQHRTGIELDNTRECMQQGGLTGTGRTHNRHGLTGENIEAHVTQHRVVAVRLVQVTGRNNRTAREGRLLHLLRCLSRVALRLTLIVARLTRLVRLDGLAGLTLLGLTLLSGILTGRLRRLRRGH